LREGGGYNEIHDFCKDLSLCLRSHAVFDEEQWFNVYCFATLDDADEFLQRFGGDRFEGRAATGRVGIAGRQNFRPHH
jgi:hypothetical protein